MRSRQICLWQDTHTSQRVHSPLSSLFKAASGSTGTDAAASYRLGVFGACFQS